jgi:hypothetical protein
MKITLTFLFVLTSLMVSGQIKPPAKPAMKDSKTLAKKDTVKVKPKPIVAVEEKLQVRLDTAKGGKTYESHLTLLKEGKPVPPTAYTIGLQVRPNASTRQNCLRDTAWRGSLVPEEPVSRFLQKAGLPRAINDRESCFYQAESVRGEVIGIFKLADPKNPSKGVDKTVKVVIESPFSFVVGSEVYVKKAREPKPEVKVEQKSLIIKHSGDSLQVYLDKVTEENVRYSTLPKGTVQGISKRSVREIQYADGHTETLSEKIEINGEEDWEKVEVSTSFRQTPGLARRGIVRLNDKTDKNIKTQVDALQKLRREAAKLKAHLIVVEIPFAAPGSKPVISRQADAFGY